MSVPEPTYDLEDAALPDGETVVLPKPEGPPITLRFPSPFEAFMTLQGQRIVQDSSPDARRLQLWLSRRLPALSRALESRFGLVGVLSAGAVQILDLVELDTGRFFDHGKTRERLEACHVLLPAYAVLGSVSTKNELMHRVRAMYAAGTMVEVRCEDEGRVVSRRRLRVGR